MIKTNNWIKYVIYKGKMVFILITWVVYATHVIVYSFFDLSSIDIK